MLNTLMEINLKLDLNSDWKYPRNIESKQFRFPKLALVMDL